MQSGSASSTLTFGPEHRQSNWDNFASSLGCDQNDTFTCIGKLPTDSPALLQGIVTASTSPVELFPWVPTLDGPGGVMPDLPSRLFKEGKFARIPFISGDTLDEG